MSKGGNSSPSGKQTGALVNNIQYSAAASHDIRYPFTTSTLRSFMLQIGWSQKRVFRCPPGTVTGMSPGCSPPPINL
jgi:hypothetical protein